MPQAKPQMQVNRQTIAHMLWTVRRDVRKYQQENFNGADFAFMLDFLEGWTASLWILGLIHHRAWPAWMTKKAVDRS